MFILYPFIVGLATLPGIEGPTPSRRFDTQKTCGSAQELSDQTKVFSSCKRSRKKKVLFLVDSPLRGGDKGLSIKKKKFF